MIYYIYLSLKYCFAILLKKINFYFLLQIHRKLTIYIKKAKNIYEDKKRESS